EVLVEHPLKQPDHVRAILHDQPVLRLIAHEDRESQLLVELLRGLDVLDGEADGKISELHGAKSSNGSGFGHQQPSACSRNGCFTLPECEPAWPTVPSGC